MTRMRLWQYLSASLWFVPFLCVLAGIALSFVTIALDRLLGSVPTWLSGDPDAALAILTTVAASMVTLTGLVLTITMVVVQLAMGQFTPRVLRTILRDRPSQIAIGVFVATFAHAMLVMREVKAPGRGDPDGYVPGLAIVVAYVLIVVSVMVLVSYVHHIGQSLRAASLIDSVGDETRKLIDHLYPERPGADDAPLRADETSGPPDRAVAAPQAGVLTRVGVDKLVEIAERDGLVISLLPRLGDFVPSGSIIFALHGANAAGTPERELVRTLIFGKERTLDEDVAYGFRLLVDVAVRSLSSAMGDPATAVQALDRIHDCLRQLAPRPFSSGRHTDSEGNLRLTVPTLTWAGYVELACAEIVHQATSSIQVTRRLRAMLDDVMSVASEERRAPLERQARLLEAAVRRAFDGAEDAAVALSPDQQGIGSGAELVADRYDEGARRATTGDGGGRSLAPKATRNP